MDWKIFNVVYTFWAPAAAGEDGNSVIPKKNAGSQTLEMGCGHRKVTCRMVVNVVSDNLAACFSTNFQTK